MTDEPPGDPPTQTKDAFATTEPGDDSTRASSSDIAAPVTLPAAGYELGDVLGRGGMGEVVSAHDLRIGRDVALKRMISASPSSEALTRFLREARVQARLEHPAIVPVHELGTDAAGRPYFTMKRLAGRTLAQRLTEHSSLHRMLRAFVEVCLAIEFAHARGVVHRDLKPSNIMLGDYGEVYVLDWGIARVLDEPRRQQTAPHTVPRDIETLGDTTSGALLGTLGYMAPEQLRGIPAGRAADVYALGAILFEILVGEPLHPRGQAAIGSTLARPQVSPSERTDHERIAPELDALCTQALSEDQDARPTAHEVAERVQRYLEGDRDLERRRALAAQQLASAREALAGGGPESRAAAMRRAGRALALDPQSTDAAAMVSSLLLTPPSVLPPDLVQQLDAFDREQGKHRARNALYGYFTLVGLLPFVLLLDIDNWTVLAAFYATVFLGMLLTRDALAKGRGRMIPILAVALAMVVICTRFNGPFILTPIVIGCVLVGATAVPWVNERTWLVCTWCVTAVMLPFGLEWTGVLPPTWTIVNGVTLSRSDVFAGTSPGVHTFTLLLANLVLTMLVGFLSLWSSRHRQRAQRELFVQSWHLRQLVPSTEATRGWNTQLR